MLSSIRALLASAVVTAFVVVSVTPVGAEDIDIFTFPPNTDARTDVLIILDSSANWSSSIAQDDCAYADGSGGPIASNPGREQGTKMAIEKCALYNLVHALSQESASAFNIGLMLFNESPAANSGGYPRHAIVELTAANATALKTTIRNLSIGDDKGNNAAFAKSLYEAYLYLTQGAPYKGTAGGKWDPSAVVGGSYRLPESASCAKHVIFITNGGPGEVTDNEAYDLLAAAGGNTTKITYAPSQNVSNSDAANWADEFARFLRVNADIRTHTVAVTGASSDGNYPNFIKNIAVAGGGSYESAADSETLVEALLNIFNRIQAVSSVFSSASLPVSVNARGTYENQIFMGMFLPDERVRPRWVGNLKQYQFAYDPVTDTLRLVDAAGRNALNTSGGFLDPGARSFWSHSSTFWANAPAGVPASASDSPDGAIVAKGGAAQVLRDDNMTLQATRKVVTCIGCASGTLLGASAATRFDTTNTSITKELLGVATVADAAALINWTRGTDNANDEQGPGGTTTVRPSIHGDVLHSRAAVVNYGGTDGVVVFYGANDGMLHAIYGAQTGSSAGRELWTFVPEEHYSKLKRLRDNSPLVTFPNLSYSDPHAPRDYFVDGPISIYQKLAADGTLEKVYLFAGMRRGGRFLYAFDVTDPTRPRFLWKRSNTSSNFDVLGQTWSEAKIAKLKGHVDGSGRPKPVLIMGAGYDPAEDAAPAGQTTMGNAVLVLDAETGSLLSKFATSRPVPADVTTVDSDADGYVDRAYAVDVGGRIYRIDFESTDPVTGVTSVAEDAWDIRVFADLGSLSEKFLYGPEVVLTKNYAIVQAGTGDREKPLSTSTQDYFYTVIDRHVMKGFATTFNTIAVSDLVSYDQYATATDPKLGCFIQFAAGEKVVNAPKTIGGVTYFATNRPTPAPANSCSANLGEARAYAAPLVCKAPVHSVLEGGGLPPTSVTGEVIVDGQAYTFIIGAPDTSGVDGLPSTTENEFLSPIAGSEVELNLKPKRTKVYWYTESER